MQIRDAKITLDGLVLDVPKDAARRFVYGFKPGEYELRKARQKRSLNANAYAWKLINDIALAIRQPPLDVYRAALQDIPTLRYILLVAVEDVKAADADWTRDHIGRRTEAEPAWGGYCNMYFYAGSSDFDRRQMSMLIDRLIDECHRLNLETRPQDEVDALLRSWGD